MQLQTRRSLHSGQNNNYPASTLTDVQVDGSCLCQPGYSGSECQTKCRPGTFGKDCSSICVSCQPGHFCHHITGDCIKCDNDTFGEVTTQQHNNTTTSLPLSLSYDRAVVRPASARPLVRLSALTLTGAVSARRIILVGTASFTVPSASVRRGQNV